MGIKPGPKRIAVSTGKVVILLFNMQEDNLAVALPEDLLLQKSFDDCGKFHRELV